MSKVVKILDSVHGTGPCVAAIASDHPAAPAHARQLREALARFIREAAQGSLQLQNPPPQATGPARGAGHLHLHAEVFLQMSGWTRFTFPHGQLALEPGQVLVVPPKLLHDEWVSGRDGDAFCNLVISADSQRMSCHLAHEGRPGVPASLYLETCQHPDAMRIEGWLRDAATPPADDSAGLWPLQQRALLLSALTGVARLLDAPHTTASTEPALLGKLRMLVQNRMGEVDLTVAALALDLGCTADYLSHLYSSHTGEHLWQVILQQRLTRAARLLTESQAAVKEVAWCSGFASASYFIRCFKQRFGATPKAYRQQAAGSQAVA
ncbi:helix-turn-helix transcriptional regulator [Rhodoferax sp.]|uniref:helix-turn-helix transcriptional regulator n=1 Tax=Rhodoferax sp. TaxID=50421 RepID=UPI0025D3A5E0|nr:helix-turn-helix transcriptional regulator [Rhodoferax sp.]